MSRAGFSGEPSWTFVIEPSVREGGGLHVTPPGRTHGHFRDGGRWVGPGNFMWAT